jgi:hypothetical protein
MHSVAMRIRSNPYLKNLGKEYRCGKIVLRISCQPDRAGPAPSLASSPAGHIPGCLGGLATFVGIAP